MERQKSKNPRGRSPALVFPGRHPAVKPPALPPGSPFHTGDRRTKETRIDVVRYNAESIDSSSTTSVEQGVSQIKPDAVTWLHVVGLHETEKISQLGQAIGMHPLLVEDTLNTHGRSKVDQWTDRLFITLRMLAFESDQNRVENQRFSMFAAAGIVVTFVEAPTHIFEPVRQRISGGLGRIRAMSVDYLAWALLDAVVDHYFEVVDALDERLVCIDENLQDGFDDVEIAQLYRMHAEVLAFHRLVRPVREIANSLSHRESELLTAATDLFYRDLYDHAVHLGDQASDLHEQANSLRDFFLATVNNRMNEVMKLLACVSTIFLPLTFLAGIYGMNFKYLPEFEWRWGYAYFWIVALAVAGLMLWVFRRKRWL